MLRKLVVSLCLCVVLPVVATQYTWTGTQSGAWTTAGNWSGGSSYPQAAGDTATLSGTTNTTLSLSGASISLGELDLVASTAGTSYTINPAGGTFTFVLASGSSLSSTTLNVEVGNANSIAVPITLTDPLTVTQTSGTTVTLSGAITGSVAMTIEGEGTLVLSGTNTNTYTGAISLDSGTLSISSTNTNLGANSSLTIGNGALLYTSSDTTSRNISLTDDAGIQTNAAVTATLQGVLSGAGSLTTSGVNQTNSIVVLTNTFNSYQGGTTVAGGILQISADGNLGNTSGSLNIGNGTLNTGTGITTARSGTIFGAGTLTSTGSNTFSGSFDGSGSLTFAGGGTFTMSGSNIYSGGNTINTTTTLSGNTSSIPGDITFGAAGAIVIFNQSFDGTNTGDFSGAGTFRKQGTGVMTVTGSSAGFTGATSVQAGTLIVDGTFSGSSVTVSSGATLRGSGSVGTTTVSGTIAPGSSVIGTLSVSGNLTLNAGASTHMKIAPLSADKIAVSGNATTTGPLVIDPIPGFYGFNASYTILTSTGLTDGWSPVTSTVSGFVPSISDSGNNVLLSVQILTPFALFPFSNANTASVGHNINALTAAGELTPGLLNICNEFIGQSISAINDALDQMHPAPYSAFTELQAEFNGQLISLFHRLPYLPCACQNPNRLWIEGIGNSLTVKRHGMQLGFQANSGGLVLGYDGNIGNSCVLGVGGAWVHHSLNWQHHRGWGKVNGVYGSVYVDSQVGDFYFGSALLAGMDFYDTSRHIRFFSTDEHAHARYSALDLVGQISTAYLFGAPQAFFYPYLNLDYLYLHTHSFRETGADGLDLHVFERTDGTLRTEMGLGLQVQDRNAAETVCISPLVSLGWVNMCPVERPRLESAFEGATIPFKVTGWDQSWNLFNINFALSIAYYCSSFMIDYNVEFSPDHHTTLYNQNGRIRFDLKW